jgi:hypothetical protein
MGVVMELHNSWKWIVVKELQINCNELHHMYSELQFYNSCNLFVNIHNIKCELQVVIVTQKLSYKASCKRPFFVCAKF